MSELEQSPPIVYVKRRRKRKYSRGLRQVQKLERGFNKANRRMAKSYVDGIREWEKRRDKAAKRRRDGAISEAVQNALRASSRMMVEMSKSPADFASSLPRFNTKVISRLLLPTYWIE